MIASGPRPMTAAENEAFTLHALRTPVEQIQAKTKLRPAQIAAAVDLGRLHAQHALRPPAAPLAAPPVRRTPAPRLPFDVQEKLRVLTESNTAMRGLITKYESQITELRAQMAAQPTAEPGPGPAPEPAPAAASAVTSADADAVREWATAAGWTVPAGRLPGAIVLAFRAAHGGTQ